MGGRERDAVRGGRDTRLVGNGTDCTERLRRLSVSHHLAIDGINPGEVLVVTLTCDELTGLSIVGGVVSATNTVIYVLTEVGSVGTGGIAGLEAELVATHEVVPLDNLLVSIIVSVVAGEAV